MAGNTETHPRLANIVIGAMSACAPERSMASESCTGTNFVFGGNHPDYDEYFACYDIMSGGWGGRFGEDGNDCVIAINGNCRFNPTEVFEARFPFRVEECAMVTNSGGAGQWRGGLGYTRTLLATSVTITGSQCSDRHEVKPWALFGGAPGGNGGTLVQKGRQRGLADGEGTPWQGLVEQVRQRPLRARRPHQADHAGRRGLWRSSRARRGQGATRTCARATSRPRPRAASMGWTAAGLIDLRGAIIHRVTRLEVGFRHPDAY